MRATLIIAERDETFAQELGNYLTGLGCTVLGYTKNGSATLKLVDECSPQLILLNVDLENSYDGIETANIIGDTLYIPIIFLTSRDDATLSRRIAGASVYGFFSKGIDLSNLRAMVELALLHDRTIKSLYRENDRAKSIFALIDNKVSDASRNFIEKFEASVQKLLSQKNILEESPNPMLRISARGAVLYSNKAGQKLLRDLGIESDQNMPGKYISLIKEVLQSESSRTFPMKTSEKTHTMFLIPIAHENCVDFYGRGGVVHDHAAAPLEGSEVRFRALMEKRSDIACCLSSDGRLTFVNDTFCNFFGRERDMLMEMNIAEALRVENNDAFDAALSRLRQGEQAVVFEQPVLNNKKEEHWIEWDCRVSFGSIGEEVTEVLVTGRVIDDLKTLAKLEKEKELVDSVSRMKTEFLANVSHELRTPVSGILGMTDLLLDTELTCEQHEYAQTINNSTQALLSIINDLLDFAQVEEGKLKLEMADFDLRQAVENVVRLLAPRASEKNLELLLHYSTQLPSKVLGDQGRIRQVLLNLINNAIKFTAKGNVFVQVDCVPQKDGVRKFTLSVEDTGIGIPGDKLDAIFERFTQADPSTTRFYGGTGLGLSISRQLAQGMHGDIGVSSIPAHGTTFWFSLPLPAAQMMTEDPPPSLHDYGHLLSLYLVCTHDTVRRIYSRICLECGVECTACNEDEIYTLFDHSDKKSMCIVLFDQSIQGIDYIVAAQELRANFKGNLLKLVLLVNPDVFLDEEIINGIAFDAVLSKPLFPGALTKLIHSLIFADDEDKQNKPEQKTPRAVPLVYSAKAQLENACVLLVEDNVVNQRVAMRLLEKFGAAVVLANNGSEALECLLKNKIDLVLMDCQMPVMDGYTATREIRNPDSPYYNPHLPVLALTAHRGDQEEARTRAAGMNDFLSKPIQKSILMEKLCSWLERAHTHKTTISPEKKGDGGQPQTDAASAPAAIQQPQADAAADTPAVFDRAGAMGRLEEDEQLLRELIQVFMESLDSQLAAIHEAVNAGNAATAETLAHSLKGGSSNIGAERLRQHFYAMEMNGREGKLDAYAERLQAVPGLISELKNVLAANGYAP